MAAGPDSAASLTCIPWPLAYGGPIRAALKMDALLDCEVAADLRGFVIAAATFVNTKDGTVYHVSSVMGAEAVEGGKKLQLALVSNWHYNLSSSSCRHTFEGISMPYYL